MKQKENKENNIIKLKEIHYVRAKNSTLYKMNDIIKYKIKKSSYIN